MSTYLQSLGNELSDFFPLARDRPCMLTRPTMADLARGISWYLRSDRNSSTKGNEKQCYPARGKVEAKCKAMSNSIVLPSAV